MDWTTTADSLLRAVAPGDLAGVPIYLLDEADLVAFDSRFKTAGVHAWTSRYADLLTAEYLKVRGRFEGFGFVSVFGFEQPLPEQLGTALHELAHWLDFGGRRPETRVDVSRHMDEMSVALRKSLPGDWASKGFKRLAPWQDHEERFVRAASHLAYRAGEVMECIRPKHVRFAEPYYRPPYNEAAFMDALSSELRRSGCIRDILASEPPTAFSERWQQATGL